MNLLKNLMNQDICFLYYTLINARSLKSNFSSVLDFINKYQFNVVAISETWLKHDVDNLDEFAIEGYHLYVSSRQNKRGGGVAIYASNDFRHSQIYSISGVVNDCVKYLTIQFECSAKKTVNISCMYRSPGCDLKEFNEHFSKLIFREKHAVLNTDAGVKIGASSFYIVLYYVWF